MDPQPPNVPEVPATPEMPQNPKDSHGITIAAMAIFVLLSLATVAFLYYQNQQLKTMLASYQTQATPVPSATTDPTANWETYISSLYSYSVKHPIDWQISETKHNANSIIDSSKKKIMTELANGKSSIKIFYEGDFDHGFEPWVFKNSEKVDIGGKEAIKSIFFLEGNPNEWINYTIEDFHDFRIEANVSPADESVVNQILSTFQFIGPTASPSAKPVACTLDAKICPDGSSVGRTGPNCEFAACPTP